MRKTKKLGILVGVLAAACVVTLIAAKHEEKKEQIKESEDVVLTLDPDTVTALSWTYTSEDEEGNEVTGDLAFHKDESWLYDADEAFPTDDDKIASLIAPFEEFGVSFIIEDVEDYDQYGLTDPVCTISLTADGTDYEIKLGAYSTLDEKRYVSIGDGNVYLVSDDPFTYYEVELKDLIKNDSIPYVYQAESIEFSGSEDYTVEYDANSTHTCCASDLYFADDKPLDTSKISSYLSTLSYLGLSDYASYNVSDEELEAFGLAEPDLTATVNFEETDEDDEAVAMSYTFSIGLNQEEKAAAEEKAAEEEAEGTEETADSDSAYDSTEETEEDEITAYLRVGDSQIVYIIPYATYETLAAVSYDDLRHDEVVTADFDDITRIDVTLDGQAYAFVTEETEGDDEDEVVRTWYYEGEELDTAGLESAINALTADSFTDEAADGEIEISLKLTLDNENIQEIELTFCRYDGESCLVQENGETVSLVPRSQVVDLMEAVNAIVL